MQRILRSVKDALRNDWGLILAALVVASFFWWDVDENLNMARYFPDVEVRFINLDPTLHLARDMKIPKVGVRVTGPKVLQDLDGIDFLMRVDLSEIRDATTQEVILNPKGFAPIVPGLLPDDIRVRQGDIIPSRIQVSTEWNSQVARVVPRYSPKPALGYVISATYISPATITLAGSDAELQQHLIVRNRNELVLNGETENKEHAWTVEDLDIGNLKVLEEPKPLIRFRIFIEPFFRKRGVVGVPIKVSGLIEEPSQTIERYRIEPSKADLMLQGARLKVNSVAEESLVLDLNIANLPPGEHQIPTIRLTPVNLPNDIQIIEATPESIHVWIQGPHSLESVFQEVWNEVRDSYLTGRTPQAATQALSVTPLPPNLTPVPQTLEVPK